MWYVYVLRSRNRHVYYKGLTSNLGERLQRHCSGRERSTRDLLPIDIIHVEVCRSRQEARQLEKYLKSGFGREIIKEIATAGMVEWQTRRT